MSILRFFRRRAADAELTEEINAHITQEIEDNLARGMSAEEARRRAYVKFGSRSNVREDLWEWNSVKPLANMLRDLRYVGRTLRRAPGFTLAVILVMALGIGANTALFTIVRSVLLRPLPFGDAKRLVMLYEQSNDGRFPYNVVAGGIFDAWQKQSQSFEQMGLLGGAGYTLSGGGGQLPEQIQATRCSWNLFSVLEVQPALGRGFDEAEDRRNANATTVLSWGLWNRRFGGDPGIVGRNIQLDGKAYTVLGVMPSWFVYPDADTQLWTPIYHETPPDLMTVLDDHEFLAVGLLKPGVTMAQGLSEIDSIVKRIHDEHPFEVVGKGANIRWLLDDMVGDYKTPLYVLLAATSCVLLIACLNVANLLVARSAARQKEIAIRSVLGGSRWRLIREQITESVVLAAVGGVIGLELAHAAVQWMVRTRHDMARADTIHLDALSLLFAAGITLLAGTFAGLVSTLSSQNKGVLEALQESSRGHGGGRNKARLRKVLLSVEVSLTVVLLIAAGLLLKSYEEMRSSDLGCATKNVLTMQIALPDARYGKPAQADAFFERLITQVRNEPGVRKAGLVTLLPGEGYGGDNIFNIIEHPPLTKGEFQFAIHRAADPGYFDAMQIPLLRGRSFREGERLQQAKAVVVSDLFARRFFAGEDPIGKHLRANIDGSGPKEYEIIGVVGDSKHHVIRPAEPMMYFPMYIGVFNRAAIVVRPQRDAASMALPIQKLIAKIDPDLAVSHVLTMQEVIGRETTDASFNAELTLSFAVLSLVLAAIGLYGVLSYLVAQRTSEIGVRVALGAQRGEVLRLTLADGLRPAGSGLLVGLAGGAAAAKMIRDLLYGIQPLDASVFVGVAALLLGMAILACVLPAWRASRLDPVQALRAE